MTPRRRIIGAASEFYRLRVTSVDATEEPDFEWHDDILFRTPTIDHPEDRTLWAVEAVALGETESVHRISCFDSYDEAVDHAHAAEDDLADLTKSGFEERYLDAE
ncbi:MAG: hypothetical protein RBS78_01820 [Coriobacteriia bacterium]|jgi:hypothetical protein|nr:hypothetical protein [Coriobacteriia bacterium]